MHFIFHCVNIKQCIANQIPISLSNEGVSINSSSRTPCRTDRTEQQMCSCATLSHIVLSDIAKFRMAFIWNYTNIETRKTQHMELRLLVLTALDLKFLFAQASQSVDRFSLLIIFFWWRLDVSTHLRSHFYCKLHKLWTAAPECLWSHRISAQTPDFCWVHSGGWPSTWQGRVHLHPPGIYQSPWPMPGSQTGAHQQSAVRKAPGWHWKMALKFSLHYCCQAIKIFDIFNYCI